LLALTDWPKCVLAAYADHNELAYLTPELHSAPYGTFACLQAPELGGATLLADCRRVLETLKESLGEVSLHRRQQQQQQQQQQPQPPQPLAGCS